MKTFSIIAFSLIFGLAIQTSSYADGFKMKEEAYINDIPFDTHKIAGDYMLSEAFQHAFEMTDETMLNDIPFDTETIAGIEISRMAMNIVFRPASEEAINDIPFSTTEVAGSFWCHDTIVSTEWPFCQKLM
jgi:hypothetical protein